MIRLWDLYGSEKAKSEKQNRYARVGTREKTHIDT